MAFAVAKPAYLGCYVLPGAVAPGLGNLHSRYKPATFGPNSWLEPESTPEAPGALDRDSSLVPAEGFEPPTYGLQKIAVCCGNLLILGQFG